MTRARETSRTIALAALVVLSVVAGSVAFAGSASAEASSLSIVSEQPVQGSGEVTVRTTVSYTGADVSFKVQGAEGTVSQQTAVSDGGPADQSSMAGVVKTTLDLGTMFESKPASGTGIVYAAQGPGDFSIAYQTFDTKRQVAIDSDAPSVTITGSAKSTPAQAVTAQPGQQVKIFYTVTDSSQEVSSTMELVGPNGNVVKTFSGLQVGQDRAVQFTIPSGWSGSYDVRMTSTDAAGHQSSDTFADGLVVETSSSSGGTDGGDTTTSSATASNLRILSSQPVKGSGSVAVKAQVSATGAPVTFKVQDASGAVSQAVTVTDGGAADQSSMSGVVEASLDLGSMYSSAPASGTAIVYAGGGDSFSISQQTFDTKRQVTIDSTAPSVTITGSAKSTPAQPVSAKTGQQIKIFYTLTDNTQEVSSTMELVGPNGNVVKTFTGLSVGSDRAVQFTIPKDWSAGNYDIRMSASDAAGHQASDTFTDGLVVEDTAGSTVNAKSLKLHSSQPVKGTGTMTVSATVTKVGAHATFKVQDANGRVSQAVTVTDGGSADQSSMAGVVKTTLDLGTMFDTKPASGTAVVYAAGGKALSISQQTFDTKLQVSVDATAPTVTITGGTSNTQSPVYTQTGMKAQIVYTINDVPQKIQTATMKIKDQEGNTLKTITGLQGGNQNAQFMVPTWWLETEYDIVLTATDEVGHTTTATYENGFVVDNTQPTVASVTTGHRVGGPSTKTRKMAVDIREKALKPGSIDKKDFEVVGYHEKGITVKAKTNDVIITLAPQSAATETSGSTTEVSDEKPLLERGEQPAVYIASNQFIADKAGNKLYGEMLVSGAATDGLVPKNPDSIVVTPGSISDPTSVTVDVHFTRRKEVTKTTSSGGTTNVMKAVADPPEAGTIHVRFTGPNGKTVVRTMPANTDGEVSSATFDLSGTGLSAGEVKVDAKIVDDSASQWTNAHGYDAPAYVTLESSTSTTTTTTSST